MKAQAILGLDARFIEQSTIQTLGSIVGEEGKFSKEYQGMGMKAGLGLRSIGIPAGFWPNIGNTVIEKFYSHAAPWVVIGQRERLEMDNNIRQILPYTILSRLRQGVEEFFLYQRTHKVGESRLGGKISVGLGGHIDLDDVVFKDNIINLQATVEAANIREFCEEVVATTNDDQDIDLAQVFTLTSDKFEIRNVGFINDKSDAVGQVHFAVVNAIRVPADWQFVCREDELVTYGWYTASEALERFGAQLESWSNIVLKALPYTGGAFEAIPKHVRIAEDDTLSQLAITHATTVEKLQFLNSIEDPDVIQAGALLRVR